MPPVPPAMIRGPADELAITQGCTFDPAAAERPIRFIEAFCRQSKGRWGGQPLTLLEWQRDFLRRLYGWKRADGTRRYRRAYLEVAKKNGKSTLVSALVLYGLIADKEPAAEVYLNAVDREQAGIVWEEAARMVRSSPELTSRLDIIPSKGRIVDEASSGKIQKNSADVASKDGVNASLWVFDEVHRMPSREMHDIFRYAGASREQPLEINITTAGEDTLGIWYELRDYSEAVNNGTVQDTSHLGVVYRAADEDDIDSPETWKKANPSLGVTLSEDDFRRDLEEAKRSPAQLANFRRLRLNIITQTDSPFVEAHRWQACGVHPAEDLEGRACYGGLDLSSTTDLTALVFAFPDDSGVDLAVHCYMPAEQAEIRQHRDRVPYLEWARQGFLTLTPGDVVDYSFVRRDILAAVAAYDVQKILADPFNATHLCLELQAEGVPVEFLRQGFLSLNAPTKELERLILTGQLRHPRHPVLTWCIGNARVETDAADCHKLSKKKSRERIDAAAATVNAVAGLIAADALGGSVYDSRGILTL